MAKDDPVCPHCKAPIEMSDGETYCGHTTYWGEEGPKAHDCPKCGVEIYLNEHVLRWWTTGRTPEEARDAF